jgi:hypothetical protein
MKDRTNVRAVVAINSTPADGYGATKAALINMCEALRPELARHNVDMSLINPGFVATPLTDKNNFPMPFLIFAEEAATGVLNLPAETAVSTISFDAIVFSPLARAARASGTTSTIALKNLTGVMSDFLSGSFIRTWYGQVRDPDYRKENFRSPVCMRCFEGEAMLRQDWRRTVRLRRRLIWFRAGSSRSVQRR